MNATLLLVRHGETQLNQAGLLRGRLDVPLTPHGIDEARAVARRIAAEYEVMSIYSSPLLRARQTADALASACGGLTVAVDPRFVDVDYGAWAGKPPQGMSEHEAREFMRWLRDPAVPLPGAEEPQAVEARAMAAIEEIGLSGASCAVIVSHDAVLQLLLRHILGLPLRSYRGIGQHTATLNELRRSEQGWAIRLLNSTWHLEVSDVSISIEAGTNTTQRPTLRETSAGGIVFYHGLVLVLQLLNGDWVLPKGRLEDGEHPEEAAVREVLEESGVAVDVVAPIDAIAYTFETDGGNRRKMVHWFAMRTSEPALRPPDDEFAAAAWTTIEDACRRLRWESQREVVRKASRIMAQQPPTG